jgi:hypothetical protein
MGRRWWKGIELPPNWVEVRTAAWEFGSHSPEVRQSLRKRYGYDPSGTPAPDRTLVKQLDDEAGLETCLAQIAASASSLEKLSVQLRRNAC